MLRKCENPNCTSLYDEEQGFHPATGSMICPHNADDPNCDCDECFANRNECDVAEIYATPAGDRTCFELHCEARYRDHNYGEPGCSWRVDEAATEAAGCLQLEPTAQQ